VDCRGEQVAADWRGILEEKIVNHIAIARGQYRRSIPDLDRHAFFHHVIDLRGPSGAARGAMRRCVGIRRRSGIGA